MPIGILNLYRGAPMVHSRTQPQFKVRLLKPGSDTVSEQLVAAPTAELARQQAQAPGYVVLSCQKANLPWYDVNRWAHGFSRRPSAPNYAAFCREFRTLLAAGMTVVEAVDTLGMHNEKKASQASVALGLQPHLEAGLSVSEALFQMGDVPPVLLASIKAGERTSDLVKSLDDYLAYQALVEGLRRKIVSASVYPVVVSVFGVFISMFLLVYVLPNFAGMYQNLRGAQAAKQSMIVGFAQWVQAHQLMAAMVCFLGVGLVVVWVNSGKAKNHLLAGLLRFEWFAKRLNDFNIAMVFQAMVLLLRGGYTVPEALEIGGRVAATQQMAGRLSAAKAGIEKGQNIAHTLQTHQLCDAIDARLLAAGERNGQFHQSLEVVASIHRERFELFVERLSRVIEPILLLLVALLVGTIVVVMYLPIFDMTSRLR